MSLLTEQMDDCVMLNRQTIDDGYGGTKDTYTEGASFKANIYLSQSIESKLAETQGVKGIYQVLIPREITMDYHSVFKRLANPEEGVDEQIFRVTSKDDNKTPKSSSLNLRSLSAEEWSLPNDYN